MKLKGIFQGLVIRRHRIASKFLIHNAVVDAGLDHILSTQFLGGAQSTSWYMGLIDTGASLNNGDTMASHGGWTEKTTYNEATRPAWSPSNISVGYIGNTTFIDFTLNADSDLDGIFIVDENTKAGITGNLWSTAKFKGGTKSLLSGDVLRVKYSLSVARS